MNGATGACLLGLLILLRGEIHRDLGERILGKFVASFAFWTVGILANPHTTFGYLMVVGLGFGVLGDIAMLVPSGFMAGLGAFLAGHLLYVIAFVLVTTDASWWHASALVPIAVSLIAMRWLWPHLGAMRVAVVAYVTVITLMAIGALAICRAGSIAHPSHMLAGAVLFYASDLWVAREKFVAPSLLNKIVGLPLYFGGQLLIAWAIRA